MPSLWKQALDTAVRIFMPEVCAGCGVSGSWICPRCFGKVTQIDQSTCCRRCGALLDGATSRCRRCEDWWPGTLEVRSVFLFDGPLQQSIHRMKYRGEFARSEWHGSQLGALFVSSGWPRPDLLLPVALHARKLKSRGYNQSEHLARHCGKALDVPVGAALTRIRNTPSQTGLSMDARSINVAGAFVCDGSVVGKHVVLIDDVVTTGATLLACSSACLDAGAESVRAITVGTASRNLSQSLSER